MKQALRYNNKVVKKIYQGDELVKKIDKVSVNRYSKQYLTIESTSDDNTISWKSSASSLLTTISASTDNGVTWTEYTAKVGGTALATLNTGDKLLVKGENSYYSNSWIGWRGGDNRFSSTNVFEVKGNIMSLVSGDSFANADKLTASYTFHGLFLGCNHLTSAENLILPATTLTEECYGKMFQGCTSLTKAPKLPAMNLARSCYFGMFYGCSNLTKAPELPATTLVTYCYQQMFVNCRKLNYIKCLATYINVSGDNPTGGWIGGVSSTGTFVKNAAMNDWSTGGDSGIPSGWAVENTTPSKKSTDVFQYIKKESDTPKPYEEQYLTISGATKIGIVYTTNTFQYSLDNGRTWNNLQGAYNYGEQTNITVNGQPVLFKASGLPVIESDGIGNFCFPTIGDTDITVYGNVMSLVYGDNFVGQETMAVSQFLGLFYYAGNNSWINSSSVHDASNLILPSKTLSKKCYRSMFSGSSIKKAPELPATTLVDSCYYQMFSITDLNYIKCLATDISATNCTFNWLANVVSTGTFVKDANTTWTRGTSGIPNRWSIVNA